MRPLLRTAVCLVVVVVLLELALATIGLIGSVVVACLLFGGALYVAGRGRERLLHRAMRRRRR